MQLKKKIYLIVSSYSIFFINTFLFYVGYNKHLESSKNILNIEMLTLINGTSVMLLALKKLMNGNSMKVVLI